MEKKEIKIVGLDLDGTLLTDKKELLPYTKNVIGEALQNGTVVLVATGRPWTGVPEELRELPGMDYALTANGQGLSRREPERYWKNICYPKKQQKKQLQSEENMTLCWKFILMGRDMLRKMRSRR